MVRTPIRLVAVSGIAFAMIGLCAAAAVAVPAAPSIDRTITDPRITESSGLAAGVRRPGVLWTVNDSGNSPRLYAIGRDGRTQDAVTVTGVLNRDWEALAAWRDRSGKGMIAIGDIGDNRAAHPFVEIAIVPEPPAGATRARPLAVLRLRYPDGPVDAEALLADRDGRLYVVTKELLSARVFAVPSSVWSPTKPTRGTRSGTLTPLGGVRIGLVTDGVMLPDGRMALRTYSSVRVLPGPEQREGDRFPELAAADTPPQDQGETLTVSGGRLLIGSEGSDQPVYRMAVPAAATEQGGAQPGATQPGATQPGANQPGASRTGSALPTQGDLAPMGSRAVWLAPTLAAAGTALAFVVGAVMLRRRF